LHHNWLALWLHHDGLALHRELSLSWLLHHRLLDHRSPQGVDVARVTQLVKNDVNVVFTQTLGL